MLWVLKELIQTLWKASWRREAADISLTSDKEYFSREEREIYFRLPKMISWNEP